MGITVNIGNRNSTFNIIDTDATIKLAKFDIVDVANGNGIVQGSDYNSDAINIEGEIHANGGSGLRLFGLDNIVTAGFDSIITGSIGIWLLNASSNSGLPGNTLLTKGQIVTSEVGIRSESLATTITNLGTIHADEAIVGVTYGITLDNKKLAVIDGGSRGIDLSGVGEHGGPSHIVNGGTISGDIAIVGSDTVEVIVNQGVINGNILLGGSNDIYDGRGGILHGLIDGGDGSDVYIIDTSSINLHENEGSGDEDQVASSVSFTLGANFENLYLEGKAKIHGFGNEEDNEIHDNSGDNTLRGKLGNDALFSGKGHDMLWGGGDSDVFVFEGHFGHDTIMDFVSEGKGSDVIDFSGIASIRNFSDLKHHATEHGDDLIIQAGHGDVLTLHHVDKHDLHAFDFSFGVT